MKSSKHHWLVFSSCTSLAALACSAQDVTSLTELGASGPPALGGAAPLARDGDRAPLGPVEARLSVEGGDLVVSLQNFTRERAQVSLNVDVDDPLSSHVNDGVSQLALGPQEH